MKIAVTYENGQVFQHFGHTAQFKLYDVENGTVASSQVVDTNGSGHGALAGFLKDRQVDALICGGIGGGAQMALAEAKRPPGFCAAPFGNMGFPFCIGWEQRTLTLHRKG